jgi:hypothetical protein
MKNEDTTGVVKPRVKTNEILRYEVKPEEFEDMFLSCPHL